MKAEVKIVVGSVCRRRMLRLVVLLGEDRNR